MLQQCQLYISQIDDSMSCKESCQYKICWDTIHAAKFISKGFRSIIAWYLRRPYTRAKQLQQVSQIKALVRKLGSICRSRPKIVEAGSTVVKGLPDQISKTLKAAKECDGSKIEIWEAGGILDLGYSPAQFWQWSSTCQRMTTQPLLCRGMLVRGSI